MHELSVSAEARVRLRAARPPRPGRADDRHAERGARTSGSRFAYLLGDIVRLHVATVQYALDKLGGKGFTPVIPPGARARGGDRRAPASSRPTREQVYRIRQRRSRTCSWSGTSEVSLAALHMGEILDRGRAAAALLPASRPASGARPAPRARTRAASSARTSSTRSRCSRSSRPTRPPTSTSFCSRSSARIADDAWSCTYRVMNIAVGDLGAPAAKKYDIEAWLPGQRPLSRADLGVQQHRLPGAPARRAAIRQREGRAHLHTLNGTAITIVAHPRSPCSRPTSRSDGSVSVPEVLQGYGAPAEIRAPR